MLVMRGDCPYARAIKTTPGSRHRYILAALLLHDELCEACGAVSGCGGPHYYVRGRVLQGVYGVVASQAYGSLFNQIPPFDSFLAMVFKRSRHEPL